MLKSKLGDRLDNSIRAIFPFLFRRQVNPNLLTLLGTLVSVGAAAAFVEGEFVWGAVLLGVSGLFDLVDGVVARHHDQVSSFGAFLDSTMDRLVDMVILLGLLIHYAAMDSAGVVLLVAYTLVVTVLVSYSKARAESFVEHLDGGFLERAERVVILILGGLTGFMVIALFLVALGSTITVLQRISSAYRELEQLDSASRNKVGDHP